MTTSYVCPHTCPDCQGFLVNANGPIQGYNCNRCRIIWSLDTLERRFQISHKDRKLCKESKCAPGLDNCLGGRIIKVPHLNNIPYTLRHEWADQYYLIAPDGQDFLRAGISEFEQYLEVA